MRAGISSENNSSRRSGMNWSQPLVAAVAQRLFGRALAGAEPDLLRCGRLELDRREVRHLVRAVAEGLILRTPAGAPPVGLAGLDVDRDRLMSAALGHLAHHVAPAGRPPPSVASHASPQALARSRTRRM